MITVRKIPFLFSHILSLETNPTNLESRIFQSPSFPIRHPSHSPRPNHRICSHSTANNRVTYRTHSRPCHATCYSQSTASQSDLFPALSQTTSFENANRAHACMTQAIETLPPTKSPSSLAPRPIVPNPSSSFPVDKRGQQRVHRFPRWFFQKGNPQRAFLNQPTFFLAHNQKPTPTSPVT